MRAAAMMQLPQRTAFSNQAPSTRAPPRKLPVARVATLAIQGSFRRPPTLLPEFQAWLAGVATTCGLMALVADPALAAEALAPAPATSEVEVEEKRPVLPKDELARMRREVEASLQAVSIFEERLQAELASKDAEASTLRSQLLASQEELERQKQLLAAAAAAKAAKPAPPLVDAARALIPSQAAGEVWAFDSLFPNRYALLGVVGILGFWGLAGYRDALGERSSAIAVAVAEEKNKEVEAKAKEVEAKAKEVQALKTSLQQADQAVAVSRAGAEAKAAEVQSVTRELGRANNRLLSAQVENGRLANGLTQERAESSKLRSAMTKLEEEYTDVRSKLKELEAEVASLMGTNSHMAAEKVEREVELTTVKRELAAANRRLLDAQMEVGKLSNWLAQERSESNQLRVAVKALQSDYGKLKGQLQAAESEINKLLGQLNLGPARSNNAVPSSLLNGTSHNGATPPGHVRVSFHLQRELPLGQVHMLVGSHPALGEWDLRQGLYMGWSEGDVWQSEAWLPPHAALEFKCVSVGGKDGEADWEEGQNHALIVPNDGIAAVVVQVKWGGGTTLTFLDDKEAAEAFGNKRARPQKQAANGRATALVGSNKSWWQ